MTQSRLGSAIEVAANIVIGFAIVRGYVLRRYFNARLHAATIRFTGEKA